MGRFWDVVSHIKFKDSGDDVFYPPIEFYPIDPKAPIPSFAPFGFGPAPVLSPIAFGPAPVFPPGPWPFPGSYSPIDFGPGPSPQIPMPEGIYCIVHIDCPNGNI